jgi:hypothetical protein
MTSGPYKMCCPGESRNIFELPSGSSLVSLAPEGRPFSFHLRFWRGPYFQLRGLLLLRAPAAPSTSPSGSGGALHLRLRRPPPPPPPPSEAQHVGPDRSKEKASGGPGVGGSSRRRGPSRDVDPGTEGCRGADPATIERPGTGGCGGVDPTTDNGSAWYRARWAFFIS